MGTHPLRRIAPRAGLIALVGLIAACNAPVRRLDCRSDCVCSGTGRCAAKDGVCVADSAEDCRRSELCKLAGKCSLRGRDCEAGSESDCRESKLCASARLCRFEMGPEHGRCVE